MKKSLFPRLCAGPVALLGFALALLMAGCSEEPTEPVKPLLTHLQQLNAPQFHIGVPQGTAAMTVVEQRMPNSRIHYFNSLADGYAAVQYGKIDAFAFDRHAMQFVTLKNPQLTLMPESLAEENIVIGIRPDQDALRREINEFIRHYRADGTYQDMYERWFKGRSEQMPAIPAPKAPTRTIRVGTEGLNQPMNYLDRNGKLTGFDLEFIRRLGAWLNADMEINTMTYEGLIASVGSGKIDLLIANLNGTPERAKSMLLSSKYVDSDVALLVRRDRLMPGAENLDFARFAPFHGQKIACLSGAAFPLFVDRQVRNAQYLYLDSYASMVDLLIKRRIAAIAVDEPQGQLMIARHPGQLKFHLYPVADDSYGYGFRKGDPLVPRVSAIIERLRADGSIQKIRDSYFRLNAEPRKLPVLNHRRDFDGSAGTLRVGCDLVSAPMSYLSGNEPLGIELELAQRIAYELNRKVQFVPMNFSSLIESLQSGKVDMVAGCMSITEERKLSLDFASSHYTGGIMLLVNADRDNPTSHNWRNARELATRGRAGTMTGSLGEVMLSLEFKNPAVTSFSSFADAVPALLGNKIDFVIGSHTSLLQFVRSNPDRLTLLDERFADEGSAIAVRKGNAPLLHQINTALRKFTDNGTLAQLSARWIRMDQTPYQPVAVPQPPNAPALRIGIAADREPIAFVMNGRFMGLDCELAERIAAELGMRAEFHNLKFGDLLPELQAGRLDMVISNLSKTSERAQRVDFSDVYYLNSQNLLVRTETARNMQQESAEPPEKPLGVLQKLQRSFEGTFIVENRYKLLLQGLWVTILISVLSAIFGTALGFGICLMRRSSSTWLQMPAKIFIRTIQGTPIVVLLMILYYIIFGSVDISAVVVAIMGFSLNFAAYTSEMMRTGIDAVDRGQIEGAAALGFTRYQTFIRIIFPQAARHVLPVYKGEFISMVKMTSIVGYIAIQDLTKMSDIIRSRTYDAFFPLIATAVIYFVIAYAMTALLSLVEVRIDPKHRKRIVRGVAKQ